MRDEPRVRVADVAGCILRTWCRLLCRHLAQARIRPLEGNSYSGVAESLLDARDLFLCQRPELPRRQIRIQYDFADLLPM